MTFSSQLNQIYTLARLISDSRSKMLAKLLAVSSLVGCITCQACYNERINQVGACTPLRDCPAAIELLKNQQLPWTCSFQNGSPVVCCVTESNLLQDKWSAFLNGEGGSGSYVGDVCYHEKTEGRGECKALKNCEYAVRELSGEELPQTCGFDGGRPVVCCPGV